MDEAQEKCHRVWPWDQGVRKLGQINTRDATEMIHSECWWDHPMGWSLALNKKGIKDASRAPAVISLYLLTVHIT